MTRDASDRFWRKVRKTADCWLWTGAENGRGYGRFSVDGRLVYAHRWSYQQARGAIGPEVVIDHLCRNPECVRPDHLEAVAQGENTARGSLGFKYDGTCRSGRHDVTAPGATYIQPSTGRARCRACHYESNKKGAA